MKHFFVALLNFCVNLLRKGRSEFGRRGTRRSQTARAWPRAAQHRLLACFNRGFFMVALFSFVITSCVNTYEEKEQFTKKNIQSVNDKNAKKHGELIVPSLAKQYNK